MDKILLRQLRHKTVLKTLKVHYKKNMTVASSSQYNIFYLLIQHDKSIGYKSGKQVILYEGAWEKIADIIKMVVGEDLDAPMPTTQDIVRPVLLPTSDTLIASKPPTLGFLMCRLFGSAYELQTTTLGFAFEPTPDGSYLGVSLDTITHWNVDILIVIEDFQAFLSLNEGFIQSLKNTQPIHSVLLVYRGHDKQGIYGMTQELSAINAAKYVFTDYSLLGLRAAEIIASKINAAGYILPANPREEGLLLTLTSSSAVRASSRVTVHDIALISYCADIKARNLAVTQMNIIAHDISMAVVRRGVVNDDCS